MPYAITPDGVRLYFEEAGAGSPIVFVHEFGGDHLAWEPQMRHFARRHRCVAYCARGYAPSDVPADPARYSQDLARDDIKAVMDHLGLDRAHIVGLSMGGFATLHFGLHYPARAISLTVAGTGFGAELSKTEQFRAQAVQGAERMAAVGMAEFVAVYGHSAARVQFANKDPRGFAEYTERFARHDAKGSANTMRGVQGRRPSIYTLEDRLRALTVPMLILVGDEDDNCIEPSLWLKRTVPSAGLAMFPKSGHGINAEEPELFNRFVGDFVAAAELGRWPLRDPRAQPGEILKVK